MKGVIDCEDLPLNISRETYQDSSLIRKLQKIVTRRFLKMLDDESKKDPVKYNQWFKQFGNNLKAGVQSDPDNKEAIFKLLRFLGTFSEKRDEMISLDHYVDAMKTGQTKIYFSLSQTRDGVEASPFYEPFR